MNQLQHIAHHQVKVSRRQLLGILGVLGAGTGAICSCGTVATLVALSNAPSPTPTTPPPTATPRIVPTVEKPPIIKRADWGALLPDHTALNESGYYDANTNPEGWYVYPDTLKNSYQTLVIHHSGFYFHNAPTTLLEIQRNHREDRGWADIAYHFLVDTDGTIYEGRDIFARGAHVEGYNTGSVGVCLLGNFTIEAPSNAQLSATYLLNNWLAQYLQLTHLTGHNKFNDWTQCPGTFLSTHIDDMATRAGLISGTEGYIPIECGCCNC